MSISRYGTPLYLSRIIYQTFFDSQYVLVPVGLFLWGFWGVVVVGGIGGGLWILFSVERWRKVGVGIVEAEQMGVTNAYNEEVNQPTAYHLFAMRILHPIFSASTAPTAPLHRSLNPASNGMLFLVECSIYSSHLLYLTILIFECLKHKCHVYAVEKS